MDSVADFAKNNTGIVIGVLILIILVFFYFNPKVKGKKTKSKKISKSELDNLIDSINSKQSRQD